MRLIIIAALVYLAYRVFKSWFGMQVSQTEDMSAQTSGEIDDVMVKDPFCEVYFPQRNGVPLSFEGSELLFCSSECRDRFIEQHREKQG
ncbi:hypothetical protein ACFLZL_01390 [Thermodesulfobacteriota bacterium]